MYQNAQRVQLSRACHRADLHHLQCCEMIASVRLDELIGRITLAAMRYAVTGGW